MSSVSEATASQPGAEQRIAPRQSLAAFAWYQLLDETGSPQTAGDGVARAGDISQSGVCLYTSRPLPTQQLVFVEVTSGELHLSAIGVIRYANAAADGSFRIGIAFEVLPPNTRIALRKYCKHE